MNSRPVPSATEVRILDPLVNSDWDRLIVSHPDSNFFHSAAWGKVLCKTYGHKPLYLHFLQRGESVALIPLIEVLSSFTGRRGVCLPFSDSCGPLIFNEGESGFVMDKLSELARQRRWKYFEVRGERAIPLSAAPAVTFYGHRLELRGSIEEIFARFRSSVRSAIRKAEKSNLTVQVAWTREAVLDFYRLHIRTRRRHGIPPQPVSFFLNIYKEVIAPRLGFVVIAKRGSRLAAAAVFFHMGETALYKYAASDENLQEFRGSDLVMWEGIRFLARSGLTTLHLGRTSMENSGLRRFKLAWGTKEDTIKYFRFDAVTDAWITVQPSTSGFHKRVFGRLPLALNRLAGAIIYPHLD